MSQGTSDAGSLCKLVCGWGGLKMNCEHGLREILAGMQAGQLFNPMQLPCTK